jgi:putative transposase
VGHANPIITNHEQYTALGKSPEERQQAYRALFEAHITEKQLDEIREAVNSEWVLGGDRFKTRIEQKL